MKFLDADVKKPLGAVSAIEDEGNTVVFRRKGSYIENDVTKERIPIERKGRKDVMKVFRVDVDAEGKGTKGKGGRDEMDVDGVEMSVKEMINKLEGKLRDEVGQGDMVFRRRVT